MSESLGLTSHKSNGRAIGEGADVFKSRSGPAAPKGRNLRPQRVPYPF